MEKQFINDPENAVDEMLDGFVGAYPNLYQRYSQANSVIYRHRRKNKVALVTGGRAGHEPLYIGFVGKGLADAAVCGTLNSIPEVTEIYRTAKSVATPRGVLMLYGAYLEDRQVYATAAEMLEADGIRVRHVYVRDNIFSAPLSNKSERSGLLGQVYMLKIAGAACDAGLDLDDVAALLDRTNDRLWSLGAGITSNLSVPGVVIDGAANEDGAFVKFGMDINASNEAARFRVRSINQLTDMMYRQIIDDANLTMGDEVCALVSGVGYISLMELCIIFQKFKQLIRQDGIRLYDADLNNYCVSEPLCGFSVTLLKVDEELKRFLDAPCYSPYYHHRVSR